MYKTKLSLLALLFLTVFSCEKIDTNTLPPTAEPEFFLSFEVNGHPYQFADFKGPTNFLNSKTGEWGESTSWADPINNRGFGFTFKPHEPISEKLRVMGPHDHKRLNLFSMAAYHTHSNLPMPALLTLWYRDEWGQMWYASQQKGGRGVLAFSSLQAQNESNYQLVGEGLFDAELTFNGETLHVQKGQFRGGFLVD